MQRKHSKIVEIAGQLLSLQREKNILFLIMLTPTRGFLYLRTLLVFNRRIQLLSILMIVHL